MGGASPHFAGCPPRLDNRESEAEGEEDSIYLAEQEVMRGNLHSTKDLRHNYD